MHSEIGLTFASGLRSILRHDPDIILVGEIRDAETAEIAIRASLTGHLVFSTLHTNDSVSSVNRLIDMGVEPYLAACSLVACLAQRLVRRLCTHCKVEDTAVSRHVRQEIAQVLKIEPGDVRAWKGCGCVECNHTGYRGRVAIYEFFLLDEEIQDMVSSHIASSELRRTARKRGMKTLREDGWVKVANGLTTIDEISRITGNFLIDYHLAEEQEDEAGPGQQAGTEG
jgi:type II secretory ATPase GspE/PulE/Tfp pilus assembly ATPase PilB-like protein